MKYTNPQKIQQVQNWLQEVVIGLNFCPFARRVVVQKSIAYHVSNAEDLFKDLIAVLQELDTQPNIATTLILLPDLLNFESFLDLAYLAEDLLIKMNYEGIYQIATFHPDYCFEGSLPSDASNYTNKAPYPILHLLREDSVEQALEYYASPEEIPAKNIALTTKMGTEKLAAILQQCYKI